MNSVAKESTLAKKLAMIDSELIMRMIENFAHINLQIEKKMSQGSYCRLLQQVEKNTKEAVDTR